MRTMFKNQFQTASTFTSQSSLLIFLITTPLTWALERSDRQAIEGLIQNQTTVWNEKGCVGYGEGYAEDATFVNIYGMIFDGKNDIEDRHIKILNTFLKGSKIENTSVVLREVKSDVVIALVQWRLQGYRTPKSDLSLPGEIREGIFTQTLVSDGKKWMITASQNTMFPVK